MKDNETSMQVLLPLIRQIVPAVIAQDIVSVQPMTGLDEVRIEVDEFENIFGDTIYSASVYTWNMTIYTQIQKWIDSTLGEDRCYIENNKYCFTQEKDRTLFLLKWTR